MKRQGKHMIANSYAFGSFSYIALSLTKRQNSKHNLLLTKSSSPTIHRPLRVTVGMP